MNKYDAIIFDFDFTLADASEGIEHCLKQAYQKMNIDFKSPGIEKYTAGITMTELIESHTDINDPVIHENIRLCYMEFADEVMTDMTIFFEDTHTTLLQLRESGYKLGIVSNKYRYRIEDFLEKNNYMDLFEVVYGLDDMKEPKPSPEGLLKAIETLGSTPEQSLFIGDNPIDAETARRAGTAFIGVSRYGHKHFENTDHDLIALITTLDQLKKHL